MGYHTKQIKKGVLGEFSKIEEEWEELLDARLQDGKILELCEIADLYGAIESYLKKHYNITMADIAKMSFMTQTAFLEGKRVSSTSTMNELLECCVCRLKNKLMYVDDKVYCDWCANIKKTVDDK